MRAKSCLSKPFFSTTCWAVMSPTPKRMDVVMLCVSSGRAASLAWYLRGSQRTWGLRKTETTARAAVDVPRKHFG